MSEGPEYELRWGMNITLESRMRSEEKKKLALVYESSTREGGVKSLVIFTLEMK